MARAAGEALIDAFQFGYKFAHAELKNTLYHFVESILAEMIYKGTLDEVFDRSFE